MPAVRRSALTAALLGAAALSGGRAALKEAICAAGDAGGCAAEDSLSLLSLRGQQHRHHVAAKGKTRGSVQCPGSTTDWCAGDQCCPRTAGSGDKTFPCPVASASYDDCEVGHEGTVGALLAAMTREEKYRFLRGVGWVNGTWDTAPGYYIGDAGINERFGVHSQNMQDNGQGFRTVVAKIIPEVTGWPVALAVASSWSEKDTRTWAVALGKEFRAKGANVILGPGVNVHRVARGGRNSEYVSGESAYFGSRIVQPWIEGMQSQRVLAVVKHFVGNQQETNRNTVDSQIDQRTLWEVYYPPFEAAVNADVAVFMCAYNLVNGVHACGNADTVLRDLKGTMGFKGWVQSDWWALHWFAAEQGVDQEMPGDATPSSGQYYTDQNLDTLSDGKIDDMVGRQLMYMLRYGLFEPEGQVCEPPNCNESLYDTVATSPEHQELNKELATNAVMLLKNENAVLPFKSSYKKVVLLGSACNASQDYEAQLAQWDLGSYYNIGGSGRVIAFEPVSILAGLDARCAEAGCTVEYDGSDDASAAASKAEGADIVLLCGATTSTEGVDRENLEVDQSSFLVAAAAALKELEAPLVTLTISPGVILMPWANDVDAIVNVFLAGKYTGTAFAAVLFGDSNPSAKSLVTFPLSVDQTIPPCPGVPCNYTEGLFVGYAGLEDQEVLFPFGHGLSYTSFTYEGLSVTSAAADSTPEACKGAAMCATAKVTNSGSVSGVEVAQLYLGFPEGFGEPAKLLRGFVRTALLQPGDSADLAFALSERDLQMYSTDGDGGWVTPNGEFQIFVGSSSRELPLSSSFTM